MNTLIRLLSRTTHVEHRDGVTIVSVPTGVYVTEDC
jgi:hypothetical protein